jgi:tetratricopeptide (TPR) repeat protein
MKRFVMLVMCVLLLGVSSTHAAYNLEVPVEPWDEYRLQFKTYSKYLLASYDRAFVDDYEGAIREVNKAIELLPEEGLGYAERAKYHRILGDTAGAENDFKTALSFFAQAMERYRPGADKKTKKSASRKFNQADAGKLIATLRYQRGEAYFNFEQYRQASDDFVAACQAGNGAACSRVWDVKAIEKRGVQWVPLTARQFYDRKRIEAPLPSIVRVWIRREDPQPVQADAGAENYIQQQLELNCSNREFRLIEALVVSNGTAQLPEKVTGTGFAKPSAGSAPNKLMIMLCPRQKMRK